MQQKKTMLVFIVKQKHSQMALFRKDKRSQAVQREMYQLHYRRIYNTCLRIVGNSMDAEEVMHDVFLKIFDNIDNLQSEETFYSWSQSIANDQKIKNIKVLRASVVMKNLDKVTLSGACKLTANDLFAPNSFKSDCSGASNMTVNLNTNQLSIETSGASKTFIKANVAGDVNMDMSGASKTQAELKASGVKIGCSGVSSIELTGSANNITMDVSGVSKVKAENFTVKTADIESLGNSNVTVNVTGALKVNSSGLSSVSYKGSPTLDVSKSKMSNVRKL